MRGRHSTEVGTAVRKLRLSKALTLADLSERSGIPLSTLSKVELGQTSLNHDKLVRLCSALEVDLERSVFSEAEATPLASGRRSVTRAGEGELCSLGAHEGRVAAGELLGKGFTPIFLDVAINELAAHGPLQRLSGETFATVLSGEVSMLSEIYAPLDLSSGDAVYFDGRIGHAFLSRTKDPAQLLLVVAGNAPA